MKAAIHRHVPAAIFFRFLLDRPRALSVGLMLILLPMITLALISWLVTSMDGKGPDFDEILSEGAPVSAVVASTEPVTRITINSRNPVRITYRYEAGGALVTDAVQTMAEEGYRLEAGMRVKALAHGGDSILPDFPPVTFPRGSIAFIDSVFLLMGLPFFLFAFHGALTRWRLYRRGRLISGEVDFLAPAYSVPFTATRMQVAFTGVTGEGRAVKGHSVVVVDGAWKDVARGSAVRILVDEAPSERCCVVEEGLLAQCPEAVR